MSRHTHREIVPGCFRCDIGKDETDAALDRLVRVSEELGLYDLAADDVATTDKEQTGG